VEDKDNSVVASAHGALRINHVTQPGLFSWSLKSTHGKRPSIQPARLQLALLDPHVARELGIRGSVDLPRSPGSYRTNGAGQVCAARRYPTCQAAKRKTGAALLSHGRGKPGAPRP
jgi:hypothetical protein